MKTIIPNYNICTETFALLPAKDISYDTIVIKESETKYVQETPFNLIKSACYYHDYTTYEGRRDGVIFHTDFVQKTPIPINIHKGIYLFPTHSPEHIDNCWIAFHHILSIGKVPKQQATQKSQSIVYFRNGQSLILNISFHTLQKQYDRTVECIVLISGLEGLEKIYSD